MAYAVFSVVFGEQPSAAKWNILGTNDAEFNSMIRHNSGSYTIFDDLPYQTITANSSQDNILKQSGWRYVSTGGGGTSLLTLAMSYPVVFTTLLGISVTVIGMNASSDPVSILDFTSATNGDVFGSASVPTASGFTANLKLNSGTFAASQRWGIAWQAWGVKA
jgi:hypothetical protein